MPDKRSRILLAGQEHRVETPLEARRAVLSLSSVFLSSTFTQSRCTILSKQEKKTKKRSSHLFRSAAKEAIHQLVTHAVP